MSISPADALFGAAVLSCTVAQLAIVRSVLRRRQPQPDGASNLPRSRFAVEVAWAVIPAGALAWLLFATWRVMHP